MRFHNIEPNNIENGAGIRTVLWVSGCFHNCKDCHNPVTHDPEDGVLFDEESMKEILDDLNHDYIHGLTLSGGDPLTYYPEDVVEVIKKVNETYGDEKTIWLYTGFTLDWIIKTILSNTDREVIDTYCGILLGIDVLCDGKYENDKNDKDYHWVGSTNQRVIDIKKTLAHNKVVFLEPEQEKLCTTDNTETNELIRQFNKFLETR